MQGLTHALDIARRAMIAQQTAMTVIGHNIANANSEGYTRQVAHLTAEVPSVWGTLSFGNGVALESVIRKRDLSLDNELRREMSSHGRWLTRSSKLKSLEQILNEPSDTGLGAALDAFWASWAELSNSPDDMTRRAMVREEGRILSHRFNTLDQRMQQMADGIDSEIRSGVDEFNLLLGELRAVNTSVREAELRGVSPNDLRDRQDLILDRMSELSGIAYGERENGSLFVRVGSTLVLDEAVFRPLEAVIHDLPDGSRQIPIHRDRGEEVEIDEGFLGGLLEMRRESLPEYMAAIDTLAVGVIDQVNSLHSAGPSGVDFFQGTDATDMRLAREVDEDLLLINASTSGLPGDNDIALAMAQLGSQRFLAGGTTSPEEYWNGMVGRLGVASREARFQEESLQISRDALDQQRMAKSGVSLDEEMTEILRVRQAYLAAVKLVEVTDQLMDSLMNM